MTKKEVSKIINTLKNETLNLFDDIISLYPNETDILLARLFIYNIEPMDLMNGYIRSVYPFKGYIENKNEEFFMRTDNIFGKISSDKINRFKDIITQDMSVENKAAIWRYFEVFLALIEKFTEFTGDIPAGSHPLH